MAEIQIFNGPYKVNHIHIPSQHLDEMEIVDVAGRAVMTLGLPSKYYDRTVAIEQLQDHASKLADGASEHFGDSDQDAQTFRDWLMLHIDNALAA